MMVSRTENPGLWLTLPISDNNVNDLLSPNSSWSDVSSDLTVFKIYAGEISILSTAQFIKLMQGVSELNGTGLPLAMELGVLPEANNGQGGVGYGIEGFSGAFLADVFRALNWVAYIAKSTMNLSLTPLTYLSMDEPLYYGHDSNNRYTDSSGITGYAPRWSISQVATDAAASLNVAQQYDPSVRFGDIEPIPAVSPAEVSAWITDYKADTGEELAYFQADIIWGDAGWQTTLEEVSGILNSAGIPLDIILDGDGTDASPQQWTDEALANLISIYLDSKISYDSLDVQNWAKNGPTELLGPDLTDTTSGTITIAARYAAIIGTIASAYKNAYGRAANTYELYFSTKQVGTDAITALDLTTTLEDLARLSSTISRYFALPPLLQEEEEGMSSGWTSGDVVQDNSIQEATEFARRWGLGFASDSWFLVPDITSPAVSLIDIGAPQELGNLYIFGSPTSAVSTPVRSLSLPEGIVAIINVLASSGDRPASLTITGGTMSDFVYLASGAVTYMVESDNERVVDATGTGSSVIDATVATAGVVALGAVDTIAMLDITNAGTMGLNNADSNLTVRLSDGTNNLTLGYGSNITAIGSSGIDNIIVCARNQAVIAGIGTDTVEAAAYLAGAKIIGNTIGVTTLLITSIGGVALNNADLDLTVRLTDGPNYVALGNGTNITAVVAALNQWVTTGTGDDTIDATAALAGAFIISSPQTPATLDITTPGAAKLSNADSNLTVVLSAGTNNLTLGYGSDITAIGSSGVDNIIVCAPNQAVIAGIGTDTVEAAAYLAGAKIIGNTLGITTLVITSAGSVALNDADENLVIQLANNPNYVNLGNGTNLTAVIAASNQWLATGTGHDTIDTTSALAGAFIICSPQTTATLDITTAGTVKLSNADSDLTVRLTDGSNSLTLGNLGFIDVDGAASGIDVVRAEAGNQVLYSNGGYDTFIGYRSGQDMLVGTCFNLSHDVIQNFAGSDLIDITDLKPDGATVSYAAETGLITVASGDQSCSIAREGNYSQSSVTLSSDGSSGTYVHFV